MVDNYNCRGGGTCIEVTLGGVRGCTSDYLQFISFVAVIGVKGLD